MPRDVFNTFTMCFNEMVQADRQTDVDSVARQCAYKVHYTSDAMLKCADPNCLRGQKYLHMLGVRTKNLTPKLTEVPWIVSNGEHTDEIQKAATTDLLKYVCDELEHRPDFCSKKMKIRDNRKVIIHIYYEIMDPDSYKFLMNQLGPHREYLQELAFIDLVAFGRAKD